MNERKIHIDFERRNSAVSHYTRYCLEADKSLNYMLEFQMSDQDIVLVREGVYQLVKRKYNR